MKVDSTQSHISFATTGEARLWIDNDFTDRTAEQDFQTIQNIAPQDAFAADEVGLQPARVILSVEPSPDLKCEGCGGTTRNTTDQALHAHRRSQLQELTIRPRQDAGIRSRIGNDSIHDYSRQSTGRPEFDAS